RARVIVHAPAAYVQGRLPIPMTVESLGEDQCAFEPGSDQALPECHHTARQEDHRQRAREPPFCLDAASRWTYGQGMHNRSIWRLRSLPPLPGRWWVLAGLVGPRDGRGQQAAVSSGCIFSLELDRSWNGTVDLLSRGHAELVRRGRS